MSKENIDINKTLEILEYCLPHCEFTWAANVIGIVLGCDFRDSKSCAEEYLLKHRGIKNV